MCVVPLRLDDEDEEKDGGGEIAGPLGREVDVPCKEIDIGPGEPLRDGGREAIRLGVDEPEPPPPPPDGREPFPLAKLC